VQPEREAAPRVLNWVLSPHRSEGSATSDKTVVAQHASGGIDRQSQLKVSGGLSETFETESANRSGGSTHPGEPQFRRHIHSLRHFV